MAIRSEKLNRLVIGSECKASWEEMQGDGARRFCAECQREVFDFAQMTQRDIRARIEASHGRLCARLTRRAGQLAVAPTPELVAQSWPWEPRRVSPLAVTVVTAWLSLGAAKTQAAEPSASAAGSTQDGADRDGERDRAPRPASVAGGAALRGRIVDEGGSTVEGAEVVARNALDGRQHATNTDADGTFALDGLPTGIYDVTATLAGFEISPQADISLQAGEGRQVDLTAKSETTHTMMGALIVAAEPLHRLFAESDLAIAARVGSSAASPDPGPVATELQIESLLKGKVSGRKVTYRHQVSKGTPPPGSLVLAFLKASRETGARGEAPSFESADYWRGVRVLGDAELASYVKRVEALARLDRAAERRGEEDPGEQMEWLVGTAEDPHTRGEAVREIRFAVAELARVAEKEGTTAELAAADLQALVGRFRREGGKLSEAPRPAFLGAALTDGQKKRLTSALSATKSLDASDLNLFEIVRVWDEPSAITWLIRELRTVKPKAEDTGELWHLQGLATDLQNGRLQGLTEVFLTRQREMEENWPEDEASRELRRRELVPLLEELWHRFADVLADEL